ncbi:MULTISPECIES: SOS response-associated peptidase family protein [Stenotrophomonas]|uniref:SOS response-associated peptidase family protein n=1 Tax=Stenotrophomonas TaxID=40323 RepID=UPI001EEDDCCF|nr:MULTISPECIES: SOS response-associated peptidase family protein [Stenotrophomonas]
MTGATLSLQEFAALYAHDLGKKRPKAPKAMDDAFRAGATPAEFAVWAEVEQWNRAEAAVLEQELFANRKRLADAERALQVKETKKAREDVRIAGNKIDRALVKLADLKRSQPKDRDSRIFPGVYAPVIISEGGKLVIRPMRYQCRLAGKPANYDQRFPGTYNARRDSLKKFWTPAFGHTHGLMVVETFYENVEGPDGKNQVVQFTPRTGEPMLVACLWSHWTDPAGKEPDPLSFAAITDDPEPEVAAAGHDRTIINIKPEHVDAWLNPDPVNLAALHRIFDDKRHPFYEHQLAA